MRLTRREAALAMLSQSPLDAEITIPEKRTRDPDAPREWRALQAPAVKAIRELMPYHKQLRFMAAGAAQVKLNERQKGFAKLCGYERGIADIILLWNVPLRMHVVEFKLPGKPLSKEQKKWFAFWAIAGVPCSRVDNIRDFARLLDSFCGDKP